MPSAEGNVILARIPLSSESLSIGSAPPRPARAEPLSVCESQRPGTGRGRVTAGSYTGQRRNQSDVFLLISFFGVVILSQCNDIEAIQV